MKVNKLSQCAKEKIFNLEKHEARILKCCTDTLSDVHPTNFVNITFSFFQLFLRYVFTQAEEKEEFEFPEPGAPASPGKRRGGGGGETAKSGRGGRGKGTPRKSGPDSSVDRAAALEANAARWTGGPTILEDSLFRTYRSGGGLDTDTDTGQ